MPMSEWVECFRGLLNPIVIASKISDAKLYVEKGVLDMSFCTDDLKKTVKES